MDKKNNSVYGISVLINILLSLFLELPAVFNVCFPDYKIINDWNSGAADQNTVILSGIIMVGMFLISLIVNILMYRSFSGSITISAKKYWIITLLILLLPYNFIIPIKFFIT